MIVPRPVSDGDIARIVRYAPLVSIDIILRDPQGYALLGLRVNEPAKGKYFVGEYKNFTRFAPLIFLTLTRKKMAS